MQQMQAKLDVKKSVSMHQYCRFTVGYRELSEKRSHPDAGPL